MSEVYQKIRVVVTTTTEGKEKELSWNFEGFVRLNLSEERPAEPIYIPGLYGHPAGFRTTGERTFALKVVEFTDPKVL